MREDLENLVTLYEAGRCSRRSFIGALTAMVAASGLAKAQKSASFVARGINHVNLQVRDLHKSQDFYQHLMGLTVSGQGPDWCNLPIGGGFLSLDASDHVAIDHFCIGIDGFDLQSTKQKLAALSIPTTVENDTQLYFRDPDGIRVQFSSPEYRG